MVARIGWVLSALPALACGQQHDVQRRLDAGRQVDAAVSSLLSDARAPGATSVDSGPVQAEMNRLDASAEQQPAAVADGGALLDPRIVPELVGFWGGLGTQPGRFIEPSSVELDSAGHVYVAGHENRFQKFSRDGELLEIFGTAGTGDGQFNHPHGLAVDRARDDLIYVGDQNNHRLQVFDASGNFLRQWGDEQFVHIHDIGIDRASGDLFVPDYELHTVRRFSPRGELIASYGGFGAEAGRFDGAWGISTDSRGDVYVADTHNARVQKLAPDGQFLAEWGGYEERQFVKPTGVYVDAADVIYVCDSLAQAVFLFEPDGQPLQVWDLTGIAPFETEPEDVVVDPRGEHVYIGEVRQHRVLHLVRRAGDAGGAP